MFLSFLSRRIDNKENYQSQNCNADADIGEIACIVTFHPGPHLEQFFSAVAIVVHHTAAGNHICRRVKNRIDANRISILTEEIAHIYRLE